MAVHIDRLVHDLSFPPSHAWRDQADHLHLSSDSPLSRDGPVSLFRLSMPIPEPSSRQRRSVVNRRSHNSRSTALRDARDAGGQGALPAAAATHTTGVVLAEHAIGPKSNEVPAFAPLLRELHGYCPLTGHVVAELGAHFVFTVKNNTPALAVDCQQAADWTRIPVGHTRRGPRPRPVRATPDPLHRGQQRDPRPPSPCPRRRQDPPPRHPHRDQRQGPPPGHEEDHGHHHRLRDHQPDARRDHRRRTRQLRPGRLDHRKRVH